MKNLIFIFFIVLTYVYGVYHPGGNSQNITDITKLLAKIYFWTVSVILWGMLILLVKSVSNLKYTVKFMPKTDDDNDGKKTWLSKVIGYLTTWSLRAFAVYLFYLNDWAYFSPVFSYCLSGFLLVKTVLPIARSFKEGNSLKAKKN